MRDNVSLGTFLKTDKSVSLTYVPKVTKVSVLGTDLKLDEEGEKMKLEEIIERIKNDEAYKEFLELKEKMKEKGFQLDKKFAIFKDGKGDMNIVEIYINLGQCFMLKSRNEQGEDTGYMNIYFHPNERFYLDAIYCYDAFRGRKIATNLSQIADYVLQKYQGYVIRGSYEPQQLSTDRINGISRDEKELEQRADNFYFSEGYQKVKYKDFKSHPERYPNLNEALDFQLGEELAETIIVKTVRQRQKYPFQIKDGVLVSDNVLENQIEK